MNNQNHILLRKTHIQTRLAIRLFLIITCILAAFGGYQCFKIYGESTRELKQFADVAVRRLAENLILPLWSLDHRQAEKTIISEMHDDRIAAVIVRDADHDIFVGKTRDADWQIINTEEVDMANAIVLEDSIVTNDQELGVVEAVGTIELYVTQKFVRAKVRNEIVTTIVMILVLDLATLGVLWFVMRRIVSQPVTKIVSIAHAVASGNLDQEIAIEQHDEIGELAHAFRVMIHTLMNISDTIQKASNHVTTKSQELLLTSGQMSQGATEQAASAEEISTTMEQIAANITQNAANAHSTEEITLQVVQEAGEVGNAILESVKAIQQIAQKVTVIEDISRQTRMLSLNATIEAAKAQENGRGFAVVASEVRALAERSRLAAEEINQLADSTMKLTEQTGERVKQFLPNIQTTANLIQEISSASHEQSSGVNQINQTIQQLQVSIQKNASIAEETNSTSEILRTQAEQLQDLMTFFKINHTQESLQKNSQKAEEC